jgi:hypothetical protein
VRNIIKKLDAHDRTHAVTLGLRRGIIHLLALVRRHNGHQYHATAQLAAAPSQRRRLLMFVDIIFQGQMIECNTR